MIKCCKNRKRIEKTNNGLSFIMFLRYGMNKTNAFCESDA